MPTSLIVQVPDFAFHVAEITQQEAQVGCITGCERRYALQIRGRCALHHTASVKGGTMIGGWWLVTGDEGSVN